MITPPQFIPLENRGLLAIKGPERVEFLQGLVSNDVEKVSTDKAVYAALLNPQGKYLYDFFIFEMGNYLILDCERDRLEGLKKRLSLYKLRANVTLEDQSDNLNVSVLIGDISKLKQQLPMDLGSVIVFKDGFICKDPRIADIGWRCILPTCDPKQTFMKLGFSPAKFMIYDSLRLKLGLPDGNRDLISEKSILLESGFSELNGVDWKKGCFIGQELTARTKYRGLIKKRLMPVSFNGPPPVSGTQIYSGDKVAGEIRSSLVTESGGIGIALIRLDALGGSTNLLSDGVKITPSRPHWMLDEL
jgi:folate-binding protein YgfZ